MTTTETATHVKAPKHRNADAYPPEDFVILGLDCPDDPAHPLHDPERLSIERNENNILSIMAGVPVPPVISVKWPLDGVERLFVKDGRQRIMDAREANVRLAKKGEALVKIQCVIHNGMTDNDHALGVGSYNSLTYVEDTLTKALAVSRLMARTNNDFAAVMRAKNLKSRNAVRGYQRLASCDTAVHEAVRVGELSATAASALGYLPKDKQAEALGVILKSGAKSVDDVMAYVKAQAPTGEDASPALEDLELSHPDVILDAPAPANGTAVPAPAAPSASPAPSSKPLRASKPAEKDEPGDRDLKGRAPKGKTVAGIVQRVKEDLTPEEGEKPTAEETRRREDLELCVRVMEFMRKPGTSPPKVLAGFVRAQKNAEKVKAEARAAKASPAKASEK